MQKLCKKCGIDRSTEDFSKVKGSKDGLLGHCKLCESKYHKEYYLARQEEIKARSNKQYHDNFEANSARAKVYRESHKVEIKAARKSFREANREKLIEKDRRYYWDNREQIAVRGKALHAADPRNVLLHHARKRAKKYNIPFSITKNDLCIPQFCPILGIPIKVGSGRPEDGSPTIDRLIPELGYVPDNISVISYRANTIKNFGSIEEHLKVVEWMKIRLTQGVEGDYVQSA